ncbi:MAG: hypothetical protein GY696_10485, partial [Gammaproteobacteria bacterium]|nr:hypothetical protein [Gammaproteobacteria bacterium]
MQSRTTPFRGSAWVQVMAPIHCDLFAQNKNLLNNMDLRLTMCRNLDTFCILSPAATQNYKIEVENMKWYVKGVEVSKSVSLALERSMMQYAAKFPIRRAELRT